MPRAAELIFTCEHASSDLPPRYGSLGVRHEQQTSHASWDPGAHDVVRALAGRFATLPFVGSYSRLLVDLNRGAGHPDVIPAVSFGMPVPGNQNLDAAERADRLARYHAPYRRAIERAVRAVIDDGRFCLLISVHSYTPVLGSEIRAHEAGVLYDDGRPGEAQIAAAMLQSVCASGVDALPNYPYLGTGSGVYSELRAQFAPDSYAGIELETRFDELAGPEPVERFVDVYERAIRAGVAAVDLALE